MKKKITCNFNILWTKDCQIISSQCMVLNGVMKIIIKNWCTFNNFSCIITHGRVSLKQQLTYLWVFFQWPWTTRQPVNPCICCRENSWTMVGVDIYWNQGSCYQVWNKQSRFFFILHCPLYKSKVHHYVISKVIYSGSVY